MNLPDQEKLAQHIIRILKVRQVSFPIGVTSKGNFYLKYTKDVDGYEMVLDAVPLSRNEYDNRELESLLKKYWFDSVPAQHIMTKFTRFEESELPATPAKIEEKKRGRPAGSKNKKDGKRAN